ncbi:MAG: GIY-YIG nuclease family protein [Patescibacteria group bacterium]
MFYIYIIKSLKTKKYYIGSSSNIEKRLKQHNSYRVKSTKSFVPWELIYTESFTNRNIAVKREQQLKNWKSREAIEKLIKKHF